MKRKIVRQRINVVKFMEFRVYIIMFYIRTKTYLSRPNNQLTLTFSTWDKAKSSISVIILLRCSIFEILALSM